MKSAAIASVVDGLWSFMTWYNVTSISACDWRSCVGCPCSSIEDIVFEASEHADPCEFNSLNLRKERWARRSRCTAPICGVSISDDGSQCIVHSFTRIGVGKAQVCFEFLQMASQPLEEPKNSKLVWDGGSLRADAQSVVRNNSRQMYSTTSGVLSFDGLPDEMLEGHAHIEFQYSSSGHNSIPLQVMKTMGGSF